MVKIMKKKPIADHIRSPHVKQVQDTTNNIISYLLKNLQLQGPSSQYKEMGECKTREIQISGIRVKW